jgi:hypothetical protein
MNTQHKPVTGKAREYSLERLAISIQTIEEYAPKELKRRSEARKHKMEKAYKSIRIHADRLGIEMPRLGIFYSPSQYLAHARFVVEKLTEGEQTNAKEREL